MVLAFTLAEGSANDWLALALVDGYDARHFVGVAGFALFVVAMTTGRLLGPLLLDRFGRVPVLLGSAAAAFAGLLLVIVSGEPAVAAVGIVVWGLGAALGFPVGISAAADDPRRAARRVSVVSTIGYGAFLAGPPLLGFVGNEVGTLDSLYVVVAAMVPAAVLVLAVRRPRLRAVPLVEEGRQARHETPRTCVAVLSRGFVTGAGAPSSTSGARWALLDQRGAAAPTVSTDETPAPGAGRRLAHALPGSTRRCAPSRGRRCGPTRRPTWSWWAAATRVCGPPCSPRSVTPPARWCCSRPSASAGRRPAATAGSARRR